MPRKKRLTVDLQNQIVGALRAGAGLELASEMFGVARVTIWREIQRNPTFAAQVDSASGYADQTVIESLFRNATVQMNVTAQIWWLKNRMPETWRDRHELTTRGASLSELIEASYAMDGPKLLTDETN